MKVLLKLYSTQDKAADGSVIPRSSTETYLASEDYKTIIRDKLSIGGLTHKDRRLSPEYKGIVGQDDQVLINDNATHYFTRIFMKGPEDPFVYGEIEFFNPDYFTGKRKENIINLMGLLKSGVKLPVSIVIHALWNVRNEAEKIIRIKGVDFTANNAFPNAGPVDEAKIKQMSTVGGWAEDIKQFSLTEDDAKTYEGCRSVERIFSAEMELVDETNQFSPKDGGFQSEGGSEGSQSMIEPSEVEKLKADIKKSIIDDVKDEILEDLKPKVEKKEKSSQEPPSVSPTEKVKPKVTMPDDKDAGQEKYFSRADIYSIYGRNSYEALAIRDKQFSTISQTELAKLSDEIKSTDPNRVRVISRPIGLELDFEDSKLLNEVMNEAIDTNDSTVLENINRHNMPMLSRLLVSIPKSEPNRKELLKIELSKYFRNVPELAMFSNINTVRDRMFLSKYPRLILMNRVLKAYKQYWNQFGENLSDYEVKVFENLITQDINLLLRNIAKRIIAGQTINTIYGLAQFGNERISQTAIALSHSHRQVLIVEKIMGFVPEKKYKDWQSKLVEFYEAILTYVEGREVKFKMALVDRLNTK